MSKKEKVHFSHDSDFESVEELLNSAIERLDQANDRILKLLETEADDRMIQPPDSATPPVPVEGEAADPPQAAQ